MPVYNPAVSHAEVTVSTPLKVVGQLLSVINDAGVEVTEVDTGVLANSDTVIPTSKAVVTAIAAGGGGGLSQAQVLIRGLGA